MPDHLVKRGITAFLQHDVLPFVVGRAKEGEGPEGEDSEFKRAVQILNVFLTQDDKGYGPFVPGPGS